MLTVKLHELKADSLMKYRTARTQEKYFEAQEKLNDANKAYKLHPPSSLKNNPNHFNHFMIPDTENTGAKLQCL